MPRCSSLRAVLATLAITVALAVFGGAVFVYAGFFNIAATDPHWPATYWLMETARMRSIEMHARGITAPPGLDSPANLAMGTEHFAAHCAVCHGAPGVPRDDIAEGMYPKPPDLAVTAKRYTDGELFWILKHGLKMTGMPSWADHSDAELWATVAFLKRLPGMTEQQYGELVKANMMHGMAHHPGGGAVPASMDHGDMPGVAAPVAPNSLGNAPVAAPHPH